MQQTQDISAVLGIGSHRGQRLRRWVLLALAALLLAGVGAFLLRSPGESAGPRFETALVQRGDLSVLVTATGVLVPLNQVSVGSEVSGTVRSVSVDYNDRVQAGQVLARLDPQQLEARLRQSEAALRLARAQVALAEATYKESANTVQRTRALARTGLCTQKECDAAEAAHERSRASVAIAEAQVAQAVAQLESDRTALSKTVITAPIAGIILTRSVEPGQTVMASLQAPVLFTVAESLGRMALHAAVDEADVARVRQGQQAKFTVDAYPTREFPATIEQVRYAPKTVEGVVTYEAVLLVRNADLALRPGMTATADITVEQRRDALLVPTAALRFTPKDAAAEAQEKGRSFLSRLLPRGPQDAPKPNRAAIHPGTQHQVWTLRDRAPTAIALKVGVSNGSMAEVLEGEVHEGMPVLLDYKDADHQDTR